MKKKLPISINLRIIGACNLACPFCYGPNHLMPPVDIDKLLQLIRALPNLGVKKVIVTGGEPLLVPNLEQALAELHRLHIRILLNTNGILLREKSDQICRLIDWLALPLDADNDITNALMRPGPASVLTKSEIQESILFLRKEFQHLKIRIGTVVSALNHHSIIGIPAFLSGKYIPDVWKIYQFTPVSYGLLNRQQLEIQSKEFEKIASVAIEQAKAYSIPCAIYRPDMREGTYLFVEPNGDAVIISDGEEKVIGNCFDDLDSVVEICSEKLDHDKIKKRSAVFW